MLKKSVVEGFSAGNLDTSHIIVVLAVAVALGLFIYAVYRTTSKSGFYNRGFNKALAIMPVITAAIMLAMQSNLVISLGMVGALSIVRFRNAVKDSPTLHTSSGPSVWVSSQVQASLNLHFFFPSV